MLHTQVGPVDEVIMGLDRVKKTPCGFCFVVYDHPADATAAINFISGTCLDERPIRVELDPGFRPERQFGRGKSGGQVRVTVAINMNVHTCTYIDLTLRVSCSWCHVQVRDEARRHFDSGRGGKSRKEQVKIRLLTSI